MAIYPNLKCFESIKINAFEDIVCDISYHLDLSDCVLVFIGSGNGLWPPLLGKLTRD